MGSNLNEFVVRLEFNTRGEVAKAFYHDSDGCGHEHELIEDGFESSNAYLLNDVIGYHLDHYKYSHRMEPPRMCGFTVAIDGGGRLECVKEQHYDSEHHVFKY